MDGAELAPTEAIIFGGETISLFARLKPKSQNPELLSLMVDEKEVPVSVVLIADESAPIPILWGRQMIGQLEDSQSLGGSRQTARKQNANNRKILELAKKYSLMSSQSSFVLVEMVPDDKKHGQEIELRRIPVALTRGWGENEPQMCASMPPMPHMISACRSMSYDQEFIGDRSLSRTVYDDIEAKGHVSSDPNMMAYDLLGTQRPEGGFEINKRLGMQLFNYDILETISTAVKSITTDAAADNLHILWTMIVLRLLEERYADLRSTWEPLVIKSRDWLQKELKRTNPQVAGKPLDEYVAHFVTTM